MSKKNNGEAASSDPFDDDDNSEFEAPMTDEDSQASDDDFGDPQDDDGEVSAAAAAIESARESIEAGLAEAASRGARAANVESDGPTVVGVGRGTSEATGSLTLPGEESLVVYIEEESDEECVRRELCDTLGVQAASDDSLPLSIVTTGLIEAQSSNKSKFRPAPAGVSVGHFAVTAGTIGGWAKGRGARAKRLLMLSNNHILANSNNAKFGDNIIQPGRADGGVNSRDRIAVLERFVPIQFGSGKVNYVDCATGWCWPKLVRRDWVYHVGTAPKYFKCAKAHVEPKVNMIVGKTGRTTNLTKGSVTAVDVSINVNFGGGKVAHFRDQFSVRGLGAATFSAGGDSGSLVWTWDSRRNPVGLLFAGGGGTTFCNRISRVVKALDIQLL